MKYRIRETARGNFLIDAFGSVKKLRKVPHWLWDKHEYYTEDDWFQVDSLGREIPHYSLRGDLYLPCFPARFDTLKEAKKFVKLQKRGEVIHKT